MRVRGSSTSFLLFCSQGGDFSAFVVVYHRLLDLWYQSRPAVPPMPTPSPPVHYIMNKYIVTIALVNGMIGGLILVLPILAMQGGTIMTLLIILATGFFSYYSCYLCLEHLGNHSDLDRAILQHFNQSKIIRILYDILIFLNLLLLLMLYFSLICDQWYGLIYKANFAANVACNAIGLVALTFALNYFHFGAKLLCYGIVSIIGYCIFLIWLVASAPPYNAPTSTHIPLFGTGGASLAASMGQAFAIQTFFIPVLRQLPQSSKYNKYTLIAYTIGCVVYLYIAYAGSFGIVNRIVVQNNPSDQTIEMYFSPGQWQIAIVEVIYLIHLYSAYGEFLLICKKRFFNIFSLGQSKHGSLLNWKEVIFVVVLISITLGVKIGNVGISTLITVNGAVLGFFFIYLLPSAMHIACWYGPKYRVSQPALPAPPALPVLLQQNFKAVKQSILTQNNQQPTIQLQFTPQDRRLSHNHSRNIDMPSYPHSQPQNLASRPLRLANPNDISYRDDQQLSNASARTNINNVIIVEAGTRDKNVQLLISQSSCTCARPTVRKQIGHMVLNVCMVGMGVFIMVDAVKSLITGQK